MALRESKQAELVRCSWEIGKHDDKGSVLTTSNGQILFKILEAITNIVVFFFLIRREGFKVLIGKNKVS